MDSGGSPMKRFFSLLGLRQWKDVKQAEKDVYDNWAGTYDHSFWPVWLDRWVDTFAQDVPEGSSVIDIGCGTGNALLRLSQTNPSLLAGIDISPRSIAVAKAKLPGLSVDLRVGDAESDLSWPDDTFDVAIMVATVHHFPEPENVLRQAFRVLKPQGRLIIADPLFFFPFLQIVNLLLRVYPLNGDLRFFSQKGLRKLVTRCGFQGVEQKHAAFLARYTRGFKP